jgi:hypothetical protein
MSYDHVPTGMVSSELAIRLEKRVAELEQGIQDIQAAALMEIGMNRLKLAAVLTWIRSQPRSGRTGKAQIEAMRLHTLEFTLDQISREAAPQADEPQDSCVPTVLDGYPVKKGPDCMTSTDYISNDGNESEKL